MKNKIQLFLLLVYFLLPTCLFAQEIEGNDAQENIYKLGGIDVNVGVVRKFDNRYEGVKGSPFFLDEWLEGSIVMTDGKQFDNLQLKYNAYEDELIINQKASGTYYIPKDGISAFTLWDKSKGMTFKFIKLHHPKKDTESQFYRFIYEGQVSLVENVKVVFEKANYEGGYTNDKPYDEFKKYQSLYYFSTTSVKPQKLKTTIKGVSSIFPDHNEAIKTYITQRGLDCREQQALIEVFEYFHEIE